jgi:nucleoside-diphosphate-sugar epimerase
MKVLITGGIGNVGAAILERLTRAGHTLRVIGRRPGLTVANAEYAPCDVTDIDGLKKQTRGMDAVVHLAAFGNPSLGTPDVLFKMNCQGTFNVYEAAAKAGITRVVTASSINALGFGMGVRDFRISYLPVDEEHPTMPTDAYSFSKNVVEDIADFYWRRDGISGVCLRLPAVVPQPYYDEPAIKEFAEKCRAEAREMLALAPAERRARLAEYLAALDAARRMRAAELPPKGWRGAVPDHYLMQTRQDLWTAVDTRDSAQAVEKALTVPYTGSHVLFINDSHNRTGVPSRTLVELFYPEVTTFKKPLGDFDTLVSIDKARALLGYEPEYSAQRFLE